MLSFLKKKEALPTPSLRPPGEVFQDPFADTIDWTLLSTAGDDDFFSLKVFRENPQRLKYGNSLHSLIRDPRVWFWVALYAFVICGIEISLFQEKASDPELFVIYVLRGLRLFNALGIGYTIFVVWKDWSKFVIDRSMGYCWRGKGFTSVMTNPNLLKNAHSLEDVYALQLLHGIGAKNNVFYELNLVTRDGDRQKIDARSPLASTQKVAQELADFLEVPLWDRSDVLAKPIDKMAIFFKKILEKYYRKPS